MNTYATRLEAARKASGLTVREVHAHVRQLLGDNGTPTEETIRTYHRMDGPRHPQVTILAAICDAYGKTVLELAPEMADAAVRARDLLDRISVWESVLVAA